MENSVSEIFIKMKDMDELKSLRLAFLTFLLILYFRKVMKLSQEDGSLIGESVECEADQILIANYDPTQAPVGTVKH